jgi:Rrf2 family transcriptional regulator, iron-sulfur cluster assembly transcription factor
MRLEITRKADLAVRALGVLHSTDRMKGSDLAERIGSTPAFVAQVMAPLVRNGWVRSDPGPTGGYELAAAIEGISMLDVIEAIEGPTVNGRCVLRGGPCPTDENCALHDAWIRARGALLAELAAIPLTAVLPTKEVS